jgi:hypothetical protein
LKLGGIRHSSAEKLIFAHNDPADLDRKLSQLDPNRPKLVAFESAETHGIVLIGEVGGDEEHVAADYLRATGTTKPVVALIAGRHAPTRRRMGHAGALMSGDRGNATSKIAALETAGVTIAAGAHLVGATMHCALSDKGLAPTDQALGCRPAMTWSTAPSIR